MMRARTTTKNYIIWNNNQPSRGEEGSNDDNHGFRVPKNVTQQSATEGGEGEVMRIIAFEARPAGFNRIAIGTNQPQKLKRELMQAIK